MLQLEENKDQILTQGMWTIKSEGTTSRNEVITMLNAQFFTDTGQHRNKNEDAEVFL